ncbi:hypothetical protein F0344_07860 [Streptomyces finlayi]|uniref:Uncharacterized protein n=2 Tax=Streptomyces TaxID=1883 RepID=A0A7G7BUV7_9ACTN|nr:hypothetical protein [Streptomyces finlayi]QNE79122.1 hypothetical protein F0344_07860 [Streptomyces finlayi]
MPGDASPLAPLPDHRDVHTSRWEVLWQRHAHLTTPLRQRGLECDIEFGLSAYIVRVSLPDDSYLIISPPQEPPPDRLPGDPEGWIVTRQHTERHELFELIYDSAPSTDPSAPERPEARHGGSASHLIEAVDQRLIQLGLLAVPPSSAGDPLVSAVKQRGAHQAQHGAAGKEQHGAYLYGDALLALTDRLNGTDSHVEAAELLHQILDPTDGLLERLGEFFEAAGEKAKEAEEDDGFDLSYDFADAAAEIRNLGEVLHVAEERMRSLTAPPQPHRPAALSTHAPALPPTALPPARPRHTR